MLHTLQLIMVQIPKVIVLHTTGTTQCVVDHTTHYIADQELIVLQTVEAYCIADHTTIVQTIQHITL